MKFIIAIFVFASGTFASAQSEPSLETTLEIADVTEAEIAPPETKFGVDIGLDAGYSNYDGFQPGFKSSLNYTINQYFAASVGLGYYVADRQTRTGPTAAITLTYWRGEYWSAYVRGEMNWFSIVDVEAGHRDRSFQADYLNSVLGVSRKLTARTAAFATFNYGERIDERSRDDNFSSLGGGMSYLF